MTLEVLSIILTHSALKLCLITWKGVTYDGKYGLFIFFLYLEQTLHIMWLLWPGLCWQIFQFCYSFTPCKVLSWIAWREKAGYWLAFSIYNPLFFLRNTWSRMCIVQFLRKKMWISYIKAYMYPAAISLLVRRWSTCYSTEPFTRCEVVMQENSCIKLSSIFLAGFAQACIYSLGAWS